MNRRQDASRNHPHSTTPRYTSLLGSGQIEVSWGDPPRSTRTFSEPRTQQAITER